MPETRSVILSKPSWMFGAEMGSNDAGVVIGNEAVWSDYKSNESDVKRLLGMDLLRVSLERSVSAKNAVDVITNLLEKYGQGGPCAENEPGFSYFNSFIIADPVEAYVLETVHNVWAVERVTSGYRNISNIYTIQTKIDFHSNNLFDEAKSTGKWDGLSQLNFAAVFGTSSDGTVSKGDGRFSSGRSLLKKYTQSKSFDVNSMIKILRDETSGICRDCYDPFPTASSQVSLLSSLPTRRNVHFVTGTPDATVSVFKPFMFSEKSNIQLTDLTKSMEREDGKHELYKKHEERYKVLKSGNVEGNRLKLQLQQLEENGLEVINQSVQSLLKDEDVGLTFNRAVEAEMELLQ